MTLAACREPLLVRVRESSAVRIIKHGGRRLIDAVIERHLRIRTSGSAGGRGAGAFGDSNHYEPLDYPFLMTCLRAMDLKADDVVYEIGCGMGRVVCLLARERIRKCVGIELCDDLAQIAEQNLATLRGRCSEAEIWTADAALVDYHEATSIYIFNSFGPITMAAVLQRIGESLAQRPRVLKIIYVNPLHQDVFHHQPWLRKTADVRNRLFRMEATCWLHDPAATPAMRKGEA